MGRAYNSSRSKGRGSLAPVHSSSSRMHPPLPLLLQRPPAPPLPQLHLQWVRALRTWLEPSRS